MQCPVCRNPMESGSLSICSSQIGLEPLAWTQKHVWFQTGNNHVNKRMVLTQNKRSVGHYCQACELTVMEKYKDKKYIEIGGNAGTAISRFFKKIKNK